MSNRKILVTGINGYIGAHIGLKLLRKGYTLRGTSRHASAEANLRQEAFKGFDSQYEHCVVPDITVEGAFDEAVKGVQAIVHVASPVDFSLTGVEAFFGPAAGGVTSILNSTKNAGPQLNSFVLTSSIAAVLDPKHPADHVYDVSDWNTSAEPAARKVFNPLMAYVASKAISERTLWDWAKQHQPGFSVSAVNPSLVLGPPVVWPTTPDKLNESLILLWRIFSGESKTVPPPIGAGMVVDVRDVAALHVWCAEHPNEANGRRLIAASGNLPPQGMADLIRKHHPDHDVVVGTPGEGYLPDDYGYLEGGVVVDKMYAALGGKTSVIAPDKMILDTVRAFEGRWPSVGQSKIP